MAVRDYLIAVAVSAALATCFSPVIVHAEDVPESQDVETARHNFIGEVSGDNVMVRSAPRDDAYPVMKLEKGTQVTVVGMKLKWLKILPPETSFAYVPKAYVNKRGDGKIGRASHETIAKVGSLLNPLKTASMCKIDEGQDVEIIGDKDEYWMIKAPAGSCLYISQAQVLPVKVLPRLADKGAPKGNETGEAQPKGNGTASPAGPNENTTIVSETPTPGSTKVGPAKVDAPTPTTEVTAAFEKLEAEFKVGNEKQITDQPIEALLAGYTDILKQEAITASMRKVAEVRLATLKLRGESKAEVLESREAERLAADRQTALTAEHDEIKDRMKAKEVTMYAALGTLRTSSVQRRDGALYRLTDPATGRTVAYVHTADTKYAGLLGQFIAVKGTISVDAALNMKVIDNPSDPVAVDPSKLGTSVAAQIIPPSLLMHASSGSATE